MPNDGSFGNPSSDTVIRAYSLQNNSFVQIGDDMSAASTYPFNSGEIKLNNDGSKLLLFNHTQLVEYSFVNGAWENISYDINSEGNMTTGEIDDDFNTIITSSGNILEKINNGWEFVQIIGSGVNYGQFRVVDISDDGDKVVRSTFNGNNNSEGGFKVYHKINGSWAQIGTDVLGSDYAETLGQLIRISNDGLTVFASSRGFSESVLDSKIKVFNYNGSEWVLSVELPCKDYVTDLQYHSDGINQYLAVFSSQQSNVYNGLGPEILVFKLNGTNWSILNSSEDLVDPIQKYITAIGNNRIVMITREFCYGCNSGNQLGDYELKIKFYE